MTPQEQDAAKKQTRDVVSQIVKAADKMDVEVLLQPY